MFEGKKGYRVYKNKKDAEFVANLAQKRNEEKEILKVKIKNEDLAEEKGITLHQDISIASSPPSKNEEGWILQNKGEKAQKNLGEAIEIVEE